MKDSIYSSPLGRISDFKFDEKVADVFPDMINRSVPGYSAIISVTGMLAGLYAQPGTNCYDLGSSLGAVSLSMGRNIRHDNCRIIAVDNSSAMNERFRRILARENPRVPVEVLDADICGLEMSSASFTVLNFTMQFVPVEKRDALISAVSAATVPGGAMVISEKIRYPEIQLEEKHTELYHSFKKFNGYSDLEISQKRTALEKVLIAETSAEHRDRILRCGFSTCMQWFQCFNFISLLAFK